MGFFLFWGEFAKKLNVLPVLPTKKLKVTVFWFYKKMWRDFTTSF